VLLVNLKIPTILQQIIQIWQNILPWASNYGSSSLVKTLIEAVGLQFVVNSVRLNRSSVTLT